jgi:hypothetical protein
MNVPIYIFKFMYEYNVFSYASLNIANIGKE